MDAAYKTLTIIHDIVKLDTSPHTYLVTPHDIILRHSEDWKAIEKHLDTLSTEKLITIKKLDKIAISITPAGIAKAKVLKNNFVSDNFSLPDNNKKNTITNIAKS